MTGGDTAGSDALPLPRHQEAFGLAPRTAKGIVIAVLLGFGAVGATYVIRADQGLWVTGATLPALAALMYLQMIICFPELAAPVLRRHHHFLLPTQMLLTFVPFAFVGRAWFGMPGFLASSALLALPLPWAWLSFAGVVLLTNAVLLTLDHNVGDIAYITISTVLTGLVIFGMTRLKDLLGEVLQSRHELAVLAVEQERLRFARDLHDLLGYSLSTITLKCELTYRLVPQHPHRAQQELTEILAAARTALSDVRAVARGYRRMSLATEAAQAARMLVAVGIQADVSLPGDPLPPDAETVLATVLREGLTNMLRHSKANRCVVTSGRREGLVWLTIANNGVSKYREPLLHDGGSGIGNLSSRVAAMGGSVSAGRRDDGWFELTAEIRPPHDDGQAPASSAPDLP